MGFCPDCGDEVAWTAEHGNPVCDACGAPSHRLFNCCWACGESFDEENAPQAVAKGYRLEFDCDASGCAGKLAWLMPFCPWCGEAKPWRHSEGEDLECGECESSLDRAWAFCVSCGEEAPLPDDCPRCGLDLEKAHSAARCEECRHLVCGDCFEVRVVPGGPGEQHERLLCSACGAEFERPSDTEEPRAEAREEPRTEAREEPRAEARKEPPAPAEAPPPSPWEVLGVTPQTPLPEVKRAYLALVAQYHPDKVAQLGPKLQALAQEETRRLIEAWERIRQRSR
jgi:DNA-directed RNA polymerase subunit RPC12/RpoP